MLIFLWLLSLGIMSSKSIHVVTDGTMSFFLVVEESSAICKHYLFLIHPSTDKDYSPFFPDNCWARRLLQQNTSWGDVCWGQDCPVKCRSRKRLHAESGRWQYLHSLQDRKQSAQGIRDTERVMVVQKARHARETKMRRAWNCWTSLLPPLPPQVPVSESTCVGLCPLQHLRGESHLPWLVPGTEIPSQEGVGGRKEDADLLKKKPRTELRNSTQATGEPKASVTGGPASLQDKGSRRRLTGTHLTWWPRTAAGVRWQGTRSSWLRSSPGRPRRSGPGASPLPGAPAGRPRPASSSRAAGGCRDLHGWRDRAWLKGQLLLLWNPLQPRPCFPLKVAYVQLTVSMEQPPWTAYDISPHHYKPTCPSNNTCWGKGAFRTAHAVRSWWKMCVWK